MTPASTASGDEGLRASFAKVESRDPLFGAAIGFVPMESRAFFMAWTALLGELRECAFELSDPRVTSVKAGWWADELDGVARGAARHPLTRALVRHGGPWQGLGDALLALVSDDTPRADLEAAIASLRPFADRLIAVEHHLFGLRTEAEGPARALAVHWLRSRLERGLDAEDRARVPLSLFARHGVRRDQLATDAATSLRSDWARQLVGVLPVGPPSGWTYPRLLCVASDRRALQVLASGRASSRGFAAGFVDVWQAWRLVRNAALRVSAPTSAST
jgi:hypothetical protein